MESTFALFAVIIIAIVLIAVKSQGEKQKRVRHGQQLLLDFTLSTVDAMSGTQFEQYFAELLRQRGYSHVQMVGGAGDGGVDILATSPDGDSAAFQCKRQMANVSVQVVRQLLGSVSHEYPGRVPHLVTTATLTKPAADLAARASIRVIDRSMLGAWIDDVRALAHPDPGSGIGGQGLAFGRGTGLISQTAIPLEVTALALQGKKIQAIKRYRELNQRVGLKEAKDIIDQIVINNSYLSSASRQKSWDPHPGTGRGAPAVLPPEITALVLQGKKIQAIKRYRELNQGVGLKEAKDIIDQLG